MLVLKWLLCLNRQVQYRCLPHRGSSSTTVSPYVVLNVTPPPHPHTHTHPASPGAAFTFYFVWDGFLIGYCMCHTTWPLGSKDWLVSVASHLPAGMLGVLMWATMGSPWPLGIWTQVLPHACAAGASLPGCRSLFLRLCELRASHTCTPPLNFTLTPPLTTPVPDSLDLHFNLLVFSVSFPFTF